jgi:hypothetical protein
MMAELITAEYPSEWYYDDENCWIHRDTDPDGGEIAMQFMPTNVPDEETLQLILDALNAEEEEDDPAVVKAFDQIAEACGCEEWEYPGQLVRDVEALAEDRDRWKGLFVGIKLPIGAESSPLADLVAKANAMVETEAGEDAPGLVIDIDAWNAFVDALDKANDG